MSLSPTSHEAKAKADPVGNDEAYLEEVKKDLPTKEMKTQLFVDMRRVMESYNLSKDHIPPPLGLSRRCPGETRSCEHPLPSKHFLDHITSHLGSNFVGLGKIPFLSFLERCVCKGFENGSEPMNKFAKALKDALGTFALNEDEKKNMDDLGLTKQYQKEVNATLVMVDYMYLKLIAMVQSEMLKDFKKGESKLKKVIGSGLNEASGSKSNEGIDSELKEASPSFDCKSTNVVIRETQLNKANCFVEGQASTGW